MVRDQVWKPAREKATLAVGVRVHDLRHAHASWLLAGGADTNILDRTAVDCFSTYGFFGVSVFADPDGFIAGSRWQTGTGRRRQPSRLAPVGTHPGRRRPSDHHRLLPQLFIQEWVHGKIVDFYPYLAATLVTVRALIREARIRYRWPTAPPPAVSNDAY